MHVELSTPKDEKLNHLALMHVESSTLKAEKAQLFDISACRIIHSER